jgi:hypothetical protein
VKHLETLAFIATLGILYDRSEVIRPILEHFSVVIWWAL